MKPALTCLVVDEPATAEEALDLAAALRASVIILDLALPDRSGAAVCRELRQWTTAPITVLPRGTRKAKRWRCWMLALTTM